MGQCKVWDYFQAEGLEREQLLHPKLNGMVLTGE